MLYEYGGKNFGYTILCSVGTHKYLLRVQSCFLFPHCYLCCTVMTVSVRLFFGLDSTNLSQ